MKIQISVVVPLLLVLAAEGFSPSSGSWGTFAPPASPSSQARSRRTQRGSTDGRAGSLGFRRVPGSPGPSSQLSLSNRSGAEESEPGKDTPKYSRELYLREEAESPFRKVRFFVYFNLAGAALTSLAVSGARVAAGLSGINTDLLQESLVNVAVDVVGLVVVGLLFQRDLQAQESRLKRASKGAELAKLSVRASKRLIADSDLMESRGIRGPAGASERFTVNLSSLRRGRGIEKRVVIVVGGSECIAKALEEASRLQEELSLSDLLVVPVVLPAGVAPEVASTDDLPDCVALPVGVAWSGVVKDEAEEARKQDVDVNRDGFCVILKKNGKVGQRTKGIFLSRMVGEVESRKGKGYDVANI